jgi:hypothetical protein
MRLTAWVFGVAVVSLGVVLVGCSGSEHESLHKPGVYTGAKDPLIEKEASPEQQEKLLSRFNQIQTDR